MARISGRHKDTVNSSMGVTLNSSAAEITIARHVAETPVALIDKIKLSIEHPVGNVTYPDGFQFAVFAFEEGLIKEPIEAVGRLKDAILQHPEQFQDEYHLISRTIQAYADHPTIQAMQADARTFMVLTGQAGDIPTIGHLSYEQFARAKAQQLVQSAQYMAARHIARAGYVNVDSMSGEAPIEYRVHNDIVELEGVMLDFERLVSAKSPQDLVRIADDQQRRALAIIEKQVPRSEDDITAIVAYWALLARHSPLPSE